MRVKSLLFSVLIHLIALTLKFGVKTKPYLEENNKLNRQNVIKLHIRENLIVETKKTENNKKPEFSRFLSESNQTVDTQTVAKKKKKKIKFSDLSVNNINFKTTETKNEVGKDNIENNHDLSYLDDLPVGDFTKVNSIEYKYYGFFKRMRKPLDFNWNKLTQEIFIRFYKYKSIGVSACIIKTLIVLDSKGNLISTDVLEAEGSEHCVPVVIQTIVESAPFMNPPKDLIHNGKVHIKWIFMMR